MRLAALIYLERIVAIVAGLIVSVALVNNLSAEDYGFLRYILSVVALICVVAMLGFNASSARFLPVWRRLEPSISIGAVLHKSLKRQLLVFFPFTVLVYAYLNLFPSDKDLIDQSGSSLYVWLCLILTAFGNFIRQFLGDSVCIGLELRTRLISFRLVSASVWVLVILISILYAQLSLNELLFLYALFALVEALVFVSGSSLPHLRQKTVLDKSAWQDWNSYSKDNYGFTIVNFVRDSAATIIVVGAFWGAESVAIYAVSLVLPNLLRGFTPSKVFGGLIIPDLTRNLGKPNENLLVCSDVDRVMVWNIAYLSLGVIATSCVIRPLLDFLYPAYSAQSYYLVLILLFNVLFLSYLDSAILIANTLGKSRLMFKLNCLSVINVTLLFSWRELDIVFIALANLTATASIVIAFHMVYLYRFKFNLLRSLFSIPLLICVVAVGSQLLFTNNQPSLALIISVVLMLVAIVYMVKSNFFYVDQKQLIFKLVSQSLSR